MNKILRLSVIGMFIGVFLITGSAFGQMVAGTSLELPGGGRGDLIKVDSTDARVLKSDSVLTTVLGVTTLRVGTLVQTGATTVDGDTVGGWITLPGTHVIGSTNYGKFIDPDSGDIIFRWYNPYPVRVLNTQVWYGVKSATACSITVQSGTDTMGVAVWSSRVKIPIAGSTLWTNYTTHWTMPADSCSLSVKMAGAAVLDSLLTIMFQVAPLND